VTKKPRLSFLLLPLFVLACAAPVEERAWGSGGKADDPSADDALGALAPPASGVELKVTIDPAQISYALEALGLDADEAERRYVTYYDTPDLLLFEAGLVLRSRKVIDDDDDSTVKVRPLLAAEAFTVDATLFDEGEFKCEIDRTPSREVSSCSLKAEQDRGEIDDVAAGERDVDKLFSRRQEDFLALFGPTEFDFDEAVPLGPVDTRRWKIEPEDLPARLTVELWDMPDGSELMELSIKVDQEESAAAMDALLDFVTARGLSLAETQTTKTRAALTFFAREMTEGARAD
jgi:hypothetical protein